MIFYNTEGGRFAIIHNMKTRTAAVLSACVAIASVAVAKTPDEIRADVVRQIRIKTNAELSAYVSVATNVVSVAADGVSVVTNSAGAARFNYKGNDGRFTIYADGATFETKWSSRSADSVHAYRDCVELVGWKEDQADFPGSVTDFLEWEWSRRTVGVKKGGVVAFLEAGGRICAVRVVDVGDRNRGAEADELRIEYRTY